MIKGSLVALVTPFNLDGSVNYKKLEELVLFHIENNTDGLVILGTTGEASTLTFEEEEEIVKLVIKTADKRIPIIVGSGSNSTQTAIMYSQKYCSMGADALLVITPYYNKTNESGMIKHFTAVADSVDIPVIVYNVPGRTGCSISENVIKVISKHKNIVGIKEASGDMSYVMKVAKYLNDDFVMYSGNDDIIVPILSVGGVGVISVLANIMPKETHDLVFDYLNGDTLKSLNSQIKYLDLINSLFLETNPIPVKCIMNYMGFNVGPLRMPLDIMSEPNFNKLKNELESIKGTK